METVKTTESTSTTATQTASKVQKSEKGDSTLFDELQKTKTNPKDITYEEYKKLTREDIDKLYPKDTKKEQNDEATSLHIKVHMTDDETMNRVLFDKELEALDSVDAEYLKSATGVFNASFEAWSASEFNLMSFYISGQQLHDSAMAYASGVESSFHSYSMSMEVSIGNISRTLTYTRTVEQNADEVIAKEYFTASQVIDGLEMISTKYKEIATQKDYGKESHFYEGIKAFDKYKDDIKNEYSKRTQENEMVLYAHTCASSYSRIQYESYYNAIGAYEEKKYGNDEYQEVKDSLNSIASMIKDGKSFSGDKALQDSLELLQANKENKYAYNKHKASMQEYHSKRFTDEYFEGLLDKLNINDLSKDEKEIYKSILKDGWITNEEIEALSFEQIQTLSRFYKETDSTGSYIQESLILSDFRAKKLLSTAELTMDDAFNEAAYNMLKSMKSDEEIATFSSLVMETHHGIGYGSYFRDIAVDPLNRPTKNPKEVLENLILQAENGVEYATNDADREFYEGMLNVYNTLYSEYEKNIEEQGLNYKGKKGFNIDISKGLVDELSSIINQKIPPLSGRGYKAIVDNINRLLDDTKDEKIYEKRIDFVLEDIQRGIEGIEKVTPRIDEEEKIKKLDRAKEILESFQTTLQSVTNKEDE